MVDIDTVQLRKDLLGIYTHFLASGTEAIRHDAEKLYNQFHRAADDSVLPKEICAAISSLYAIAWPDIAQISKTKEISKQEAKLILESLKKTK